MLHLMAYAVAATMTGVAIWRFPAVLDKDPIRRALWGCYAGFAAALWLKTPWVVYHLNHGPVVDGSILLKHYVSVGAIVSILTYVAASYGRHEGDEVPRHVQVSRWIQKLVYQSSIGALVLLTVLFFTVVDRAHPTTDFVAEHAGQWGATTYMSVFYVYLGAASAVCCYQWSSAIKRAERTSLKVGLILMSAAMVLGVAYVVTRVTWMWVAIAHPISATLNTQLGDDTEYLQIALFFLFAAGASIPTASAVGTRTTAWRTIRDLHPLWSTLLTAVPAAAAAPPAPLLRELTRLSPPLATRVDGMVQQIGDAVDQLRHWAPENLLDAAEEATADLEDAPAAAEAAWINATLVAKGSGEPFREQPGEALPAKPITDPVGEAAWLQRVHRSYTGLTAQDGRRLLDEAKELAA
ncbi:MAB_1171c family putative transporter [Streptacidiphilus sp. EB103A]|uniref:MAB_1171c family putative transporter n=1 Tax=Streptacidiphilus sp. EB103A TaxID=3156275 RepID=UPI0035132473